MRVLECIFFFFINLQIFFQIHHTIYLCLLTSWAKCSTSINNYARARSPFSNRLTKDGATLIWSANHSCLRWRAANHSLTFVNVFSSLLITSHRQSPPVSSISISPSVNVHKLNILFLWTKTNPFHTSALSKAAALIWQRYHLPYEKIQKKSPSTTAASPKYSRRQRIQLRLAFDQRSWRNAFEKIKKQLMFT